MGYQRKDRDSTRISRTGTAHVHARRHEAEAGWRANGPRTLFATVDVPQ